MVLILSQSAFEATTDVVMDWLEHFGARYVRLNGVDLGERGALTLTLDGERIDLHVEGETLSLQRADVRAVWFRRWLQDPRHRSIELFHNPETLEHPERLYLQIIRHLDNELSRFPINGEPCMTYTAALARADLDAMPDRFFPSLFQEKLEKACEIRTFYLDGTCYSMAIFSQLDQQTQVDFRRYNLERPNRCVPYRLPAEVSERIVRLMHGLEMETGSLDLIRTPDGRHVFLEVNPVGQFGMVSASCNYYLERKVAEYLIRKAGYGKAA